MACSNVSTLCNNIVISQSVTFTAGVGTAPGTLAIDIPAGSYNNGQKYCIVVAQPIPPATTINANVVITIGGVTTTTYPLVNCDGTNVQAAALATRTRYTVRVATNIGTGVFKLLSNINCDICRCNTGSPALPIPVTAAAAGVGAAATPVAPGGVALPTLLKNIVTGGESK